MTKSDLISEIKKIRDNLSNETDRIKIMLIEHHELNPLYEALGKLIFESEIK